MREEGLKSGNNTFCAACPWDLAPTARGACPRHMLSPSRSCSWPLHSTLTHFLSGKPLQTRLPLGALLPRTFLHSPRHDGDEITGRIIVFFHTCVPHTRSAPGTHPDVWWSCHIPRGSSRQHSHCSGKVYGTVHCRRTCVYVCVVCACPRKRCARGREKRSVGR